MYCAVDQSGRVTATGRLEDAYTLPPLWPVSYDSIKDRVHKGRAIRNKGYIQNHRVRPTCYCKLRGPYLSDKGVGIFIRLDRLEAWHLRLPYSATIVIDTEL